eukprot:TRINITY_DN13591_c0_g1_i3.p1 TRINITY_DN13591_c0_g1~~TRINITY_DN13591_c0_g1_i3.p1  ORF type:complete len:230 (-),score=36.55 TRINITY_DN13591_c0_g1_i3:242-931(-)
MSTTTTLNVPTGPKKKGKVKREEAVVSTQSTGIPFPVNMFLFDWFWNVLSSLGLYNKTGKVVFLGLDNAGKTTLLHMLKDDKLQQHFPTQKPTMEELTLGGITFQTYDLGGHEIARRIWREYYADVDAVIFIVDAASRERLAESKAELDELLAGEDLKNVPFLILGNKIDLTEACSEVELRSLLGLTQTYGKGIGGPRVPEIRPIELFMCSVTRRQGYKEAFNWVAQFI